MFMKFKFLNRSSKGAPVGKILPGIWKQDREVCPASFCGGMNAFDRNKKTGLSGQRVTKKPGEFSNLVHL
jgi:hypothetical protein